MNKEEIDEAVANGKYIANIYGEESIGYYKVCSMIDVISKLQKELDKKDKVINNAKDTIEYYLLGNMSLEDFNKREKQLNKLKQVLEGKE